jgi:hypothetical protein
MLMTDKNTAITTFPIQRLSCGGAGTGITGNSITFIYETTTSFVEKWRNVAVFVKDDGYAAGCSTSTITD